MHPEKLTKAPDDYILYVWVLTMDDLVNMEDAQNPEELASYFYFRTFRYSINDDIDGDTVNLILDNIKVDDEYLVIANYVNTTNETDIVFLSPEPFSVTEDTVTQVTIVDLEVLMQIE